jgi:hypothetical protein
MRCLLAAFTLAAVVATARAEAPDWPWPPIEGNLSGDATALGLPGIPELHWTASVTPIDSDTRHVGVTARGHGTDLELEADVNRRTHLATWKLTKAVLDLAQWQTAAAHRLHALEPLTLTGHVSLTGHGILQDNVPSGELTVSVADAVVRNATAGWTLQKVGLEGAFSIDGTTWRVRSSGPLKLTIGTITTTRFGARNLVVNGTLEDLATFGLTSASIEIAGGNASAAPADIALDPFRLLLDLTVNRIGLQDVAALVPTAVLGARGRVDGIVQVAWSQGGGFEFSKGHIVLRHDEPAEVTLKPYPGLFTRGFPEWLMHLPRWLVRDSPFPVLQKAELGTTAIEAQTLDVTFSQQPDAQGRTAIIKLSGMPRGPHSRTPVNLETNVYGALRPFIQLGTETQGLRINIH